MWASNVPVQFGWVYVPLQLGWCHLSSSEETTHHPKWQQSDDSPKLTTQPNWLLTQIDYSPKLTTHPNWLLTQIDYSPKFTTHPNLLLTQIDYSPKLTTHPNCHLSSPFAIRVMSLILTQIAKALVPDNYSPKSTLQSAVECTCLCNADIWLLTQIDFAIRYKCLCNLGEYKSLCTSTHVPWHLNARAFAMRTLDYTGTISMKL